MADGCGERGASLLGAARLAEGERLTARGRARRSLTLWRIPAACWADCFRGPRGQIQAGRAARSTAPPVPDGEARGLRLSPIPRR
eukprot:12969223-Alexandrium_andersonii.AAC.1